MAVAPVAEFASYEVAEDEDLALRFQQGDEFALEELLRRHRGMACSKARNWFLPGGDADDVIQEATIGIFKAARDFSPDHNVAFGAFAELCVKRQIITAVKAAGRHKHQALNRAVAFNASPANDDGDGWDSVMASLDPDPADHVAGIDAVIQLHQMMRELLSELEVEVLHLYTQGSTYAEIAERVGRHAKAVDNAVQRIRRKVGSHLRLVTPELSPA